MYPTDHQDHLQSIKSYFCQNSFIFPRFILTYMLDMSVINEEKIKHEVNLLFLKQ